MKKPYAEVIVDIEHEKLDRPFTYRVPEADDDSCVPGSCVRIPFGSGERELLGFVVGRKAEAGLPEERIKEIRAVVTGEETAESRMILLAAWMSRRYGSTMIRALKTVLPVRKKYGARSAPYPCGKGLTLKRSRKSTQINTTSQRKEW